MRFNLLKEVEEKFSSSTRLLMRFSQFVGLHELPSNVQIIEFADDYKMGSVALDGRVF